MVGDIERIDLGEVPYGEAVGRMTGRVGQRRADEIPDRLALLTHPPVITYSARTPPGAKLASIGMRIRGGVTGSGDTGDSVRHRDDGVPLERFTGRVLVVCPRCGGRAVVVPRPGLPAPRYATELLFQPRRLACPGCGAVAEWVAAMRDNALVGVAPGGTEDPFFRRPLWLQTRCVGHILWAYDEVHVDALAAYVGARLRERGGLSPTRAMVARLPAWMKTSEHRAEILAGLQTLRGLAERSAPADRSDAAHEHGDRPRPYRSLYFRGGPY